MRSERSCHLQYTVAVIYSEVLITESQTERQADISDCRVAIASKTIQLHRNYTLLFHWLLWIKYIQFVFRVVFITNNKQKLHSCLS